MDYKRGGYMNSNYQSVLNNVVNERLETILNDLRSNNTKISKKEKDLVKFSQEKKTAILSLDSKQKDAVDKYMSELNSLTFEYYGAIYIEGFRDCVKLLKCIGIM